MSHQNKETYAAARARLHRELCVRFKGSRPDLRVPWVNVVIGTRSFRVEFRPQAVYLDAHSLFLDTRGLTCEQFMLYVVNAVHIREANP